MDPSDGFRDILSKYWGYTSFRPLQEDVMRSVVEGRDTLALMPTGGGKSITFQVPALLASGVCIVVTPLISLMRDQVANLRARGIGASYLYAGLSTDKIETILLQCGKRYKFLYVSPERLQTYLFQYYLQRMEVSLLVVDECHCISQWGYDFRPSYLHIADIRPLIPQVPILALSASVTPKVIEDIQEKLLFRQKNVLKTSFFRPNLSYVVLHTEVKREMCLLILRRLSDSAVIYVRRRKDANDIAAFLQSHGISSLAYHAGLEMHERNKRQNEWKTNRCQVIVATSAFGMGIDKTNVRAVVHLDMPPSLEAYYQEAGRAGRDGLRAYAIVLQSARDEEAMKSRFKAKYPSMPIIQKVYDALLEYHKQIRKNKRRPPFSSVEFSLQFSLPLKDVYYSLCLLREAEYIEYIEDNEEGKEDLFFLRQEERVSIPPFLYEKRKEKEEKLLDMSLRYLWQDNMCRSLFLLKYFGEEQEAGCRSCDICEAFKEKPLELADVQQLKETIDRLFERGKAYDILELLTSLPYSFDKSIAAIRYLVDTNDAYVLSDIGQITRL